MAARPSAIARCVLPTPGDSASGGTAVYLPLAQALLLVAHDRREQIAEHGALAGLDLHRDRHAEPEIDQVVVDLHVLAVECGTRPICHCLAIWLSVSVVCS